ncbi:hypothetical protein BpHYR1_051437 [Brachionus plicatilis]|uniref:Aspartic peptidase DDI1-type domain-containing protein n=1 Tax=Brachionus plicatilis TaxID=10195 RepID=A0A3M7SZ56_BRAPC|nr:hypothetical protein BpHYR1_051437 [Brachionus plicatilis]
MATTSQREAIKTVDQSWTAEVKSKLLMEFDANVKKIKDLQLDIAGKGYVLDSNTPVYYGRTAGVPEDKKLAVITPYVKETALKRDNSKARKGKIKLELFKLKQTVEFDSFLSKFQELANESSMAQEDLILIFSHALKPKCALKVQIREPKTIEEAYKIAIKFEKNLKFISGSFKEHKINCVSLLADSTSLLMTNGLINKKNVDRMVFDKGATMSIIAEDCAIKNGISFWPDETKVILADDRKVDVCGKTEALEVNIGGTICELPMLILKHKEYNILLGIDYFNLTGAGIFPKQRWIKYDKHELNLNNYEKIENEILYVENDEELDDSFSFEFKNLQLKVKPEINITKKFEKDFKDLSSMKTYAVTQQPASPYKFEENSE